MKVISINKMFEEHLLQCQIQHSTFPNLKKGDIVRIKQDIVNRLIDNGYNILDLYGEFIIDNITDFDVAIMTSMVGELSFKTPSKFSIFVNFLIPIEEHNKICFENFYNEQS